MISLQTGKRFTYPYPVTIYEDVLDRTMYRRMVKTFPEELDESRVYKEGSYYNKASLSSRHNYVAFNAVLASTPDWKLFFGHIKSNFADMCVEAVGVDLSQYKSRRVMFEFSSLPADGGGLRPHPDSPKKIATAVMFFEPGWSVKWGGAFEALQHKTDPLGNFDGRRCRWPDCKTIIKVNVEPNRMVFMKRTPYSLHGVRPMCAPRPRRSVTINLVCKNAKG